MTELERVEALSAALEQHGLVGGADGTPAIVFVLGSGLRDFAAKLEGAREVSVADLPEWPMPKVAGHGGSVVRGTLGGLDVLCSTGRVHLYEGWTPDEVVRPLRAIVHAGVRRVCLTNAAGGIAESFEAGDLMVIEDHVNLTARSALLGEHVEAFGPRFPDQTEVWSRGLVEHLAAAASATKGVPLQRGVYAGVLGPTYETPAEIRMLRTIGCHAVGMSTVVEASAAHAMGAEIAGLSLIANKAAGLRAEPLSHAEVVAVGKAAAEKTGEVLAAFCRRLAAAEEGRG
jgi:purine-nucleoside phosphorylase